MYEDNNQPAVHHDDAHAGVPQAPPSIPPPPATTDAVDTGAEFSDNHPPVMTDDAVIDEMMHTDPVSAAMPADPALDSLKQQALRELGPLLDQLDQNPEERFKTTMMMIQATDDQSLLPKAYQAANAIPDTKVKAQALLDVVNEINYFNQK